MCSIGYTMPRIGTVALVVPVLRLRVADGHLCSRQSFTSAADLPGVAG